MSGHLHGERRGEVQIARLSGEIDLAVAHELELAILADAGDATAVIVDLSAVTYFDSSGVRLLDALAASCREAATAFRVVAPEGGRARFILRIVAWPEDGLAEDLEQAVTALRR